MIKFSKTEVYIYVTFIFIGIALSIATVGAPIFLEAKQLSDERIVKIVGVTFLSAAFSPLFGAISDMMKQPKKLIATCALLYSVSAICIILTQNYYIITIAMLVLATVSSCIYGLFESVMSIISHEKQYNYGFIRSGMSLGYGAGIIVALPLLNKYGEISLLYVAAIIGIIIAIAMIKINDGYHKKSDTHYITEAKYMLKNTLFILALIIAVIIFSANGIKLSYQTIKLTKLNSSFAIISITTLILIIPEIILMPLYNKLFGKITFNKALAVANAIMIIHMLILAYASSQYSIMFVAPLHGIASAIYIPKLASSFRTLLPSKIISTGFLLRSMLSAFLNYFLSIIVIEKLFNTSGTTSVFISLIVVSMFVFIFTCLLAKKSKQKNIII